MIYCNFSDLSKYSGISPLLGECIRFIEKNDLHKLPFGITKIKSDLIYVNKMTIETKQAENAVCESHKRYIDLHIDLEAFEYIGFTGKECVIKQKYDADKDAEFYVSVEPELKLDLSNDRCFICFPGEKHISGIRSESENVVKCCFKIQAEG
ncbi:MAG: YhcH/YjgK/YiaL family protein [Fibrobacter sp.]|nr:YhcH/YjgK/YiaL family protein [Fibrobacter sp.]